MMRLNAVMSPCIFFPPYQQDNVEGGVCGWCEQTGVHEEG